MHFSRLPDIVVYTESYWLKRQASALVIISSPTAPNVTLLAAEMDPNFRPRRFSSKNPIIGKEMLAQSAFLRTPPQLRRRKRVNLYIENDESPNTLIRGVYGRLHILYD